MIKHILNTILLGVFLCLTICINGQDTLMLSLNDLGSMVLSNNLNIKKQNLFLEGAKAELNQVKENWLPDIFLGTSLHHLTGASMNTDGRIFTELDRQNRWLGGNLELDWDIGGNIFKGKAKKHNITAQEFKNLNLSNLEILRVISQYYKLAGGQEKMKLYGELISIKEIYANGLEKSVKEGISLQSDLWLTQSNLKRLELLLLQNQNNCQSLETDILNALNLKGKAIKVEGNSMAEVNLVNLETDNNSNTSKHPYLQAQQAELNMLSKEKDAVIKSLIIPDAGLEYTTGPFGESYGNAFYTNSIQAKLGWNIPLGQLIYNGTNKIAESKMKIQEFNLEESKLELENKQTLLKKQLKVLKEYLEIANQASKFAKDAFDQTSIRMNAGVGTNIEVIQAQEEFLSARVMYIDALIDYNVMQYELFVVGGGVLR